MATTSATAQSIATLLLLLSLMPADSLHGQLPIYRCKSTPQTIATNESFQLLLKHPFYQYLKPHQHCEIRVQLPDSHPQQSNVKWIVSVVNASLRAYAASAVFSEDWHGLRVLANLTQNSGHQLDGFQFATVGSNFSVDFVTTDLPEDFSTGLVLQVEPVVRCPRDWLDTGIGCYGLPGRPATAVTQPQARAACARIGGSLSNGVYNNDHIGQTLASLFMMTSSGGSGTYWVGIVGSGGSNFSYSNGFINPHEIEQSSECGRADVGSCDCVVYWAGKFLSQPCSSRHRFVCTMPHPGLCHRFVASDADQIVKLQTCDCFKWKVGLAVTGGFVLLLLVVGICCCCCCCSARCSLRGGYQHV